MQKNHRILAWALCAGGAVALLAQAADLVKPNVRLGLWEMKTTGKPTGMPSGVPSIPESVLAQMPPERRAQILASMQGAAGRPVAFRECITAENVGQGLQTHEPRPNCQRTVLASSSSELKVHEECTSERGNEVSDVHLSYGSDHVTGTVSVAFSRGGQSMTTERTIEAHWVSADCGTVKGVEMVK